MLTSLPTTCFEANFASEAKRGQSVTRCVDLEIMSIDVPVDCKPICFEDQCPPEIVKGVVGTVFELSGFVGLTIDGNDVRFSQLRMINDTVFNRIVQKSDAVIEKAKNKKYKLNAHDLNVLSERGVSVPKSARNTFHGSEFGSPKVVTTFAPFLTYLLKCEGWSQDDVFGKRLEDQNGRMIEPSHAWKVMQQTLFSMLNMDFPMVLDRIVTRFNMTRSRTGIMAWDVEAHKVRVDMRMTMRSLIMYRIGFLKGVRDMMEKAQHMFVESALFSSRTPANTFAWLIDMVPCDEGYTYKWLSGEVKRTKSDDIITNRMMRDGILMEPRRGFADIQSIWSNDTEYLDGIISRPPSGKHVALHYGARFQSKHVREYPTQRYSVWMPGSSNTYMISPLCADVMIVVMSTVWGEYAANHNYGDGTLVINDISQGMPRPFRNVIQQDEYTRYLIIIFLACRYKLSVPRDIVALMEKKYGDVKYENMHDFLLTMAPSIKLCDSYQFAGKYLLPIAENHDRIPLHSDMRIEIAHIGEFCEDAVFITTVERIGKPVLTEHGVCEVLDATMLCVASNPFEMIEEALTKHTLASISCNYLEMEYLIKELVGKVRLCLIAGKFSTSRQVYSFIADYDDVEMHFGTPGDLVVISGEITVVLVYNGEKGESESDSDAEN